MINVFSSKTERCKGEGREKEEVGYATYDIVLKRSAYLVFFSPQISKQCARPLTS